MSDARSETIRVRVTPAERARFEAAAGLEPLSSWVRRMLNHMAKAEEVGAEQSEVAHAALGMLGVGPATPHKDPAGPDDSGDGGDADADASSSAEAEDPEPVPGRGQSVTAARERPAARKKKAVRDDRGRCPHRVTAGSWCKRCGEVV